MLQLAAAAGFFVGIHLFVAGTRLRDRAVASLGERAYLGLFSLASLLGLIALITAYRRAPYVATWGPLLALHPLAWGVMALAFVLATLGLTTPSPTATGGESRLGRADAVTGILRVTRHPFLWAVALWATVHVLINGDLAALLLFGSLLALALAGPPSIDAKRARRHGDAWQDFASRTSSVPFRALLRGQGRIAPGRFAHEIGTWRLLLALALFGAMLRLHGTLFGVPAL